MIVGGCTASDPGVALEESAKPQFASLSGAIGITLGARDRQRYRIRGGEVARVDSLPATPEEAWGGDPYGARELIHTERIGQAYVSGAYLVSPDRRLIAAKLENGGVRFVIMELKTKRLVAEVGVEPPWRRRGFAWAPDSAHPAVLEARQDPRYRLLDFLLSMLHPSGTDLYGLEVYTSSGQRVARSGLTQEDIGGSGDVVWFGECASR